MDVYNVIEIREYERILAFGKGILGELTILERVSDGMKIGTVRFAIAAGPNSPVRGTELFSGMMDSFGSDANVIHGIWRKPPSGAESTNIDKVNELTVQGVQIEEAIQHTWTVTRARKRGFGRATLLGSPNGSAGSYVAIDVEMKKP